MISLDLLFRFKKGFEKTAGCWGHAMTCGRLRMQVSNDVRMLLPILVGILAAKWVADAATHSLYHGLLEVCSFL